MLACAAGGQGRVGWGRPPPAGRLARVDAPAQDVFVLLLFICWLRLHCGAAPTSRAAVCLVVGLFDSLVDSARLSFLWG